jgi:hypothetical protein
MLYSCKKCKDKKKFIFWFIENESRSSIGTIESSLRRTATIFALAVVVMVMATFFFYILYIPIVRGVLFGVTNIFPTGLLELEPLPLSPRLL